METSKHGQATSSRQTFPVAPRVWGLKTVFVNLYFVANPDGTWVLVDTGMKGFAQQIRSAADELFGENSAPQAIILTHGHFDHTGNVKELATYWQVPVYAHALEFPYLTGMSNYPPPDPSVGGGAMAYLSFTFPKKPIDIHQSLVLLPENGTVPALEGWHWVFTPGHSPGHVSLFREEDRLLIAGDAFTTRDPESAVAVVSEKRELHGPPSYYTPDWGSAHRSVEALLNLGPKVAASGHGKPIKGEELAWQLRNLVENFWLKVVPRHGRYVHEPAITDEKGVVYLPPPVSNSVPKVLAVAGAVTVAGLLWMTMRKKAARNTRHSTQEAPAFQKQRPFSHNRVMTGFPPTIDPDHDDPEAHTNNYP